MLWYHTYCNGIDSEFAISAREAVSHLAVPTKVIVTGNDRDHKCSTSSALAHRGCVIWRLKDGIVVVVVCDLDVDRDTGVEGGGSLVDGQEGEIYPWHHFSIYGLN